MIGLGISMVGGYNYGEGFGMLEYNWIEWDWTGWDEAELS
jgi:hypothetical protein